MNSESVIFFPRASARILRASSVETLKVIVGIVLRYYHAGFHQVYFSNQPSPSEAKGIECVGTGSLEIGDITGDNRKLVFDGCCRNQAVAHG
jgi:hypothetical protein